MQRLLRENREELCEAMRRDLGKSPFQGFVTELAECEEECREALAELGRWMAPRATKSSGLNMPGWSYTRADPLGVVLVFGAWNYPCNLTLNPLIGALAAGCPSER